MTPATRSRLGDARWSELKPRCITAAAHSEQAAVSWAEIAAEAVRDHPVAHWRSVLSDLREYCWQDKIECPFTLVYLVQLAETCDAVKGNFNRGVPISVLIEGRHHKDLLKIIKQKGMTVGRMKAVMYLYEHADDKRSVEEIEADQRAKRQDARTGRRKRHAEKIEGWPLEKAEEVLPTLGTEAQAYMNLLLRLRQQGVEFNLSDAAVAENAVKNLEQVLATIKPYLSEVA